MVLYILLNEINQVQKAKKIYHGQLADIIETYTNRLLSCPSSRRCATELAKQSQVFIVYAQRSFS
jgi:hypothetical protein